MNKEQNIELVLIELEDEKRIILEKIRNKTKEFKDLGFKEGETVLYKNETYFVWEVYVYKGCLDNNYKRIYSLSKFKKDGTKPTKRLNGVYHVYENEIKLKEMND